MAKSLTALMNDVQSVNNLPADDENKVEQTDIKVRDVVKEAQTAEALEVFKPKGKTVKFGNVELPVESALSPDDLKYITTSDNYVDTKGQLADIAMFIRHNIPVLVEGETGVGKTSAFRHLASLTQTPYRRLNLNGSTTVDEFVGRMMLNEKGTYWQDGVLIEAMRKGHWLVLDEINASLPEILFVLHSLLDDDRMVVLSDNDGEVVRPHKRFRVFATMNPSDRGYGGTKELNSAFLDRFVKTKFDFPTITQERKMVNGRYPNLQNVSKAELTEMLTFTAEVRTAYSKGQSEFLISPRGVLQWVQLTEMFNDIMKSAEYALISKAPAEEQTAIKDLLKMRFGMGINDYIPQCAELRDYEEGDQLVVSIPEDQRNDIATDYVGLYEVKAKRVCDPDVNGNIDVTKHAYTIKCLGKNHQTDLLTSEGTYTYLGRHKTAKYYGDKNKTA